MKKTGINSTISENYTNVFFISATCLQQLLNCVTSLEIKFHHAYNGII